MKFVIWDLGSGIQDLKFSHALLHHLHIFNNFVSIHVFEILCQTRIRTNQQPVVVAEAKKRWSCVVA